jgi:hypothetical protein
MKRFQVHLFSCIVGAVLLALLLAPAVAEAAAWSVVASPNASSNDALLGVAAVSTKDVWAVGDFINASNVNQTLIEQWNGHKWSVVPSPNVGTHNNELFGVTAVSATDIWAVGDFVDPNTGTTTTVIEQWNGTAWSVVTSPNPSASENILKAAAADQSSGQSWAVGSFFSSTSNGRQTLTEFNP